MTLYLNPYSVALKYREAGWGGPIPLPFGKKSPPPEGFTGHLARYPTVEEIQAWIDDGPHNIGLRLAGVDDKYEIIGIDVDHYVKGGVQKKGGDQLRALEEKLGPLPETWISSARTDGMSGIRYYRVPRGLQWPGKMAKDIECISKGYRFAVVWPSMHPTEGQYRWFPPGVPLTEEGAAMWDGNMPFIRDLGNAGMK